MGALPQQRVLPLHGSTLSSIAVEILDYYFSSGSGMETVEGENTLLR